jgi:hypothetical protein
MSKLLDRVREADKVWKPTLAGEALEGLLVKIRHVHFGRVFVVRGFAYGPDGKPTHERETDWLVNVGKDSTLSSRIDDAGAREGMNIAILFKGSGTSKSGREFKSWGVAVDNPEPTPPGGVAAGDPEPSPPGGVNGQAQLPDDNLPF